VLLATLILSMPARADVVGPAPEDCPSGWSGTANHNGGWCVPRTCDEQACELGTTCETVRRCVVEEDRPCAGHAAGAPCTLVHREAFGPCETDTDCDQGTCVTGRYCVEPAKAGGCCNRSKGASMVFLLGLLPLVLRRRRFASSARMGGFPG